MKVLQKREKRYNMRERKRGKVGDERGEVGGRRR